MSDESANRPPLRILIAEDHAFFRRGIREVLEEQADFEVVAEAVDGEQAIQLARQLHPDGLDLVLMDLEMPRLDGLAATRRILAELHGLPVIVLTASTDDRDLLESARSGAVGFLTKSLSPTAIVRALRDYHRSGALPMSRALAAKVLAYFQQTAATMEAPRPAPAGGAPAQDPLTPREREVIELVATGATDREIAERLIITERTVKVHLQNIFRKLNARNRTGAVARYRDARS